MIPLPQVCDNPHKNAGLPSYVQLTPIALELIELKRLIKTDTNHAWGKVMSEMMWSDDNIYYDINMNSPFHWH